jgi:hypothetical protein
MFNLVLVLVVWGNMCSLFMYTKNPCAMFSFIKNPHF